MFTKGIKCDECGTGYIWNERITQKEMIAYVRREWWTVGNKTLCRKCQRKLFQEARRKRIAERQRRENENNDK